MEQTKQNLLKILLVINLAITTCTAIGVGYVAYKQSTTPSFGQMGQRGIPGNGQNMPGQNQDSNQNN